MKIILTNHARVRMQERRFNLAVIEKILRNPEKVESAENGKLYYFGEDRGRKIKIVLAKRKEMFTIISVYPI